MDDARMDDIYNAASLVHPAPPPAASPPAAAIGNPNMNVAASTEGSAPPVGRLPLSDLRNGSSEFPPLPWTDPPLPPLGSPRFALGEMVDPPPAMQTASIQSFVLQIRLFQVLHFILKQERGLACFLKRFPLLLSEWCTGSGTFCIAQSVFCCFF